MLNCSTQRKELQDQLVSIRGLLNATHALGQPTVPDISREIRGLCIVLLYASYERLMYSLCRSILETAKGLRVGNWRLKPGLQVFASFPALQSVGATPAGIWGREGGLNLVQTLRSRKTCTISPDVFPTDGSNMKRSQVSTFCKIFDLAEPGPILKEVWDRIDGIVSARNAIAHGRLTADEVGRDYTIAELHALVDIWELRWGEFLDHVESSASNRIFFRSKR